MTTTLAQTHDARETVMVEARTLALKINTKIDIYLVSVIQISYPVVSRFQRSTFGIGRDAALARSGYTSRSC